MDNYRLKFKIWLELGENEGVLGDGKCKLLRTIDQTGSLKEAMKKLNLSYRKTWDNLNKIEELLGFPVIERQRGGSEGGKTTLTEQGKAIIQAFDNFHEKYDKIINHGLQKTLEFIKSKL